MNYLIICSFPICTFIHSFNITFNASSFYLVSPHLCCFTPQFTSLLQCPNLLHYVRYHRPFQCDMGYDNFFCTFSKFLLNHPPIFFTIFLKVVSRRFFIQPHWFLLFFFHFHVTTFFYMHFIDVFRQEIDSLCKIYKSLVTTSSHAVSKAATSTIGATQGISAVASKIEVRKFDVWLLAVGC